MIQEFSIKNVVDIGGKEKIKTLDGQTIIFSKNGDRISVRDRDSYIWFPVSGLNTVRDVVKNGELSKQKIGRTTVFGYDPNPDQQVEDDFDDEDIFYDPSKREKEVLVWFDDGHANISFFIREYNLRKMLGILKKFGE